MTSIGYRVMYTGDVPAVRDLVERTVRTSFRGVYSPRAIEFFVRYHCLEDITADARTGVAMVAILDGEVVGTAALRGAKLRRVFVEPALQGRGIGTAMVVAMLHLARDKGIGQTRLDASMVSRKMYERIGFIVAAVDSHDLGDGDSLPYYQMVKDL
jgi:GNAT superfamily N-acetyltransferase